MPQIPIVPDRGILGTSKGTDVNWCVKVRDRGITLHHRLSSQRWADDINMWPNAVLTFNYLSASDVQIVCLGYLWILRNVDENVFKKI